MVEVVDLLVSRGARVLSVRMAAGAGQLSRIIGSAPEFVVHDDSKIDVFKCAVVRYLLGHADIDINVQIDGASALHWAAWEAKLRMIEFLLTQGADSTALDAEHSATARQWAVHRGKELGPRWGHQDVVDLFDTHAKGAG